MTQICETCIYWKPIKTIKDYGDCGVPLPYWINIYDLNLDYMPWRGMGTNCATYTPEQDEEN